MNKGKRDNIVFIRWKEDIDEKLEKDFIEKKTREIRLNQKYDHRIHYIFLDKREIEGNKSLKNMIGKPEK